MLVAAACCPHPPLLVPAVARGAAAELDALRTACDSAVRALVDAGVASMLVVGAGPQAAVWPDGTAGTVAGYGVDLCFGGGGTPQLPLSLAIGAFLLDRAGWAGDRTYLSIPAGGPSDDRLGAELAARPEPTGVVCMADGSAKRSAAAPGQLDRRAGGFDAAVAGAWEAGDAQALSRLDLALARQLWAGGAPAWRALGAAADRVAGVPKAVLLHESAPYGVGYLVATWTWP